MKAEIRKEDLDSQKLSWLCIEPMLLFVRGQSMGAKKEVYLRLNEGQQALYLFYSYHNHTTITPQVWQSFIGSQRIILLICGAGMALDEACGSFS